MVEHGFDLTDFGKSSNKFKQVLKENNINPKAIRDCKKLRTGGTYCEFNWKGKGVKLVTANNPITGEYAKSGGRQNEIGYASYMGIEGDSKKVEKLAKSIKKHASWIKGENKTEREFI